jgi:hypothetical protein
MPLWDTIDYKQHHLHRPMEVVGYNINLDFFYDESFTPDSKVVGR